MGACTLMVALVMAAPPEPERVGGIFIIGNDVTPQNVILDRLPLFPGKLITDGDLLKAANGLRILRLVGLRCKSVCVLESDGPFKDILVVVEEGWLAGFLFAPRER